MVTPGTWHESDPAISVKWSEAMGAWAEAILPELEQVASVFGGSITYEDLASAIQYRTGYRTRMLLGNWIGKVLEVVLKRTIREGLAPLTSLVVRKDTGGVGDGYYNHDHPQHSVKDDVQLQRMAAQDRLTCYRVHCGSVPANATPRMTELFDQKHSPVGRARAELPEQFCPTCHLVLPLGGECDSCA